MRRNLRGSPTAIETRPAMHQSHTFITRLLEGGEFFLFNDALNTFYLRLYGVRHMVKDHSDSERKPAAATWATLSD